MELSNIDISEYIDHDAVERLVREVVKDNLKGYVEKQVAASVQRVLDEKVAELLEAELRSELKDKASEVVNNMGHYDVFRDNSRYNFDNTPSYNLLHKVVTEELPGLLRTQLREIIRGMEFYEVSAMLGEAVTEIFKTGLGVEDD